MSEFYDQIGLSNPKREAKECSGAKANHAFKKVYVAPKLCHKAHLRDITLAPSSGIHESGVGDGRRAKTSSPSEGGSSDRGRGASGAFERDIFD